MIHPPRSFKDVGLEQILRFFAKRAEFGPYSLDSRDERFYRNAEARAKAEHLGVWAR